ncbi:MAG: SH3 domain-containing protein [Sphingomonas sp.]
MKSSDISSTTTLPQPPSVSTLPRSAFTLSGRSVALDPRTHAVRADLADIRLADRVFAPHYAAPLTMTATAQTPVKATASPDAEILAMLEIGETFDVLEVSSQHCWGQRGSGGIVGYVATSALSLTRQGAERAA